jgi:hypothetical protein
MSAFNTIKSKQVCHSCGKLAEFTIQFKYGEVWQHEYHISDRLKWGRNEEGKPGYKRVVVNAVAERCPVCRSEGADFEVWIENDRIVSVKLASGKYDFVSRHQTYVVIEETQMP